MTSCAPRHLMDALSALLIFGALAVRCYLVYRLVRNKRGNPDRGPRRRVLAVGALLAFSGSPARKIVAEYLLA